MSLFVLTNFQCTGKQLVYFMILFLMCCGEITGARNRRRSRHQRVIPTCRYIEFQISQTLDSAENVINNIKCRLDPDKCSDIQMYITGNTKAPTIPVVCNTEFLNVTFKFLKTSYKKVSDISHMIERLQNKLFLDSSDPLKVLTNLLLNNIRVTMAMIKPGYDVITMTSSQQEGHNGVDSESGMLIAYTRTATRLETYLKAALCITRNR